MKYRETLILMSDTPCEQIQINDKKIMIYMLKITFCGALDILIAKHFSLIALKMPLRVILCKIRRESISTLNFLSFFI